MSKGIPGWLPLAVFGVIILLVTALVVGQLQDRDAGLEGVDGNPRVTTSAGPKGVDPGYEPEDVPATYGKLTNESGVPKDIVRFEGSRDSQTPAFSTNGGLLRVAVTHLGQDGFFSVVFQNASDDQQVFGAVAAQTRGTYEGVRYVGVPAGPIRLAIKASGGWSVDIDYPDAERPLYAPGVLEGRGPSAPAPVVFAEGTHRISFVHDGDFPLEVAIYSSNGTRFADNSGCYTYQVDGQAKARTCRIPAQGLYYFDVQADGYWRISF